MTPTKVKGLNMHELHPPTGWDNDRDGECVPLPVCIKNGAMHSYWQPSEKEIAAIVQGHPVRLSIFTHQHPPVMLDIEGL